MSKDYRFNKQEMDDFVEANEAYDRASSNNAKRTAASRSNINIVSQASKEAIKRKRDSHRLSQTRSHQYD